jgi:hypothetical protein
MVIALLRKALRGQERLLAQWSILLFAGAETSVRAIATMT